MRWEDLKVGGVAILAALNLILLMWAVVAYRRRGSLPGDYYRLLPVSVAVSAGLVTVGLLLVFRGSIPPLRHVLYGSAVAAGALGQAVLSSTTAMGQRYRARPLAHAFAALFVLLLAVRAWMVS